MSPRNAFVSRASKSIWQDCSERRGMFWRTNLLPQEETHRRKLNWTIRKKLRHLKSTTVKTSEMSHNGDNLGILKKVPIDKQITHLGVFWEFSGRRNSYAELFDSSIRVERFLYVCMFEGLRSRLEEVASNGKVTIVSSEQTFLFLIWFPAQEEFACTGRSRHLRKATVCFLCHTINCPTSADEDACMRAYWTELLSIHGEILRVM